MTLFLIIILFCIGLFCIIKGGDFLVSSALKLGKITNISHIMIGATFVAVATALPELIVSVFAVINGNYGIAVGNVVGGMTANIALILALSMIFLPSSNIPRKEAVVKSLFMLVALAFVFLFSLDMRITWVEGLMLVIFFVCFVVYSVAKHRGKFLRPGVKKKKGDILTEFEQFKRKKKTEPLTAHQRFERRKIKFEITIGFIFGQILLIAGAFVLVTNAERLAEIMGISETLIGLTIFAIAASAPELTTVLMSIRKKSGDMAIGNILGSNIINSTLLLGALVFASYTRDGALPMSGVTVFFAIPLLLSVSLLAVVPTMIKGKTYRWQGLFLVAIYVSYIILLAAIRPG